MRKLITILSILIILVIVVIQFFQPLKNISDNISGDILHIEKVPENIQGIITNACLDCHSNNTNYLWYHKVAPVSWMVSKHIVEGKKELNLSEWREMDIYDKIGNLEEMGQEVERKEMPLKSYSVIHKNARLTKKQIEEFRIWTEKLSIELLEQLKD